MSTQTAEHQSPKAIPVYSIPANQPARQARPFLGNPWGITLAEAKILVLLPDMPRKEIGAHLQLSHHTITEQVSNLYIRMRVNRAESACVYWDRWWQKWQIENPLDAPQAREQLGL